MKECRSCGKFLPGENFPRRGETSYTKGTCLSCKKIKKKEHYRENREVLLAQMAAYQKQSKVKAYQAAYFQENKAKNYVATKKWRETHPAQQKEILRKDYQLRKKVWPEYVAKRRASLLRAMPRWVDQTALREIYRRCPMGMHVDHIIPLNGNGVNGLHVPWNLQYLPAEENLRKGNRLCTSIMQESTPPALATTQPSGGG